MPAFWMEATLYMLDEEGKQYERFVEKWQKDIMVAGVRRFLQAVVRKIPVRTGFLRGAFTDLRRHFADNSAVADLNPALVELTSIYKEKIDGKTIVVDTAAMFKEAEQQKDRKISAAGREARIRAMMKEVHKGLKRQNKGQKGDERSRMVEFYRSGVGKGATKIRKTSRSGIQFVTKPDDVLKFQGNVMTFFLDVTISYYRVNDLFHKIRGSPWGSMMEGGSAFANWLGRAADLFPQISEILVQQKIALRGSRLTQTKLPKEIKSSRFLTISGLEGASVGSGTAQPAAVQPSGAHDLHKARIKAFREAKAKSGQPPKWPYPKVNPVKYKKGPDNG